MKVVLSVAENWHRRYIVEIPDNLSAAEWDDAAIARYNEYLHGEMFDSPTVKQFGEPEYIDDGPRDSHLVTGKYEE